MDPWRPEEWAEDPEEARRRRDDRGIMPDVFTTLADALNFTPRSVT